MPFGQQYSSVAVLATLTAGISNAATTCTVNSVSGFPPVPFTIAIDPGQGNQELCDVTNVTGLTLTITRGIDGSTASTHSNNAQVMHAGIGRDFREFRSHLDANGSNDATGYNVHGLGVGSKVVGTTDTQTLSAKTLTSPTINTPALNGSGGALTLPAGPDTLVGRGTTDTLTNKTLTSPTINTATMTGPTTNDLIVTGITGAVNTSRYVGSTTGGPPSSGSFNLGDYVVDNNWGIMWICITAGSPGTWAASGMAKISDDSPPNIGWTSIPSYFKHLRIEWNAVGSAASGGNGFDEMYLRFNNDTGNNYNSAWLSMINSTTLAGNSTTAGSQPRCGVTTNGTTTQAGGQGFIDIPNYSSAFQKGWTFQSGGASGVGAPNNSYMMQGKGIWSGTAAINRIDIAATSGSQFNSGNFTLYAY